MDFSGANFLQRVGDSSVHYDIQDDVSVNCSGSDAALLLCFADAAFSCCHSL